MLPRRSGAAPLLLALLLVLLLARAVRRFLGLRLLVLPGLLGLLGQLRLLVLRRRRAVVGRKVVGDETEERVCPRGSVGLDRGQQVEHVLQALTEPGLALHCYSPYART